MNSPLRSTAAWRISLFTTVAFALGTAFAFVLIHALVARSMQQRSDSWLTGESQVISEIAEGAPPQKDKAALYNRLVKEIAELANHEVADPHSTPAQNRDSVFFLEMGKDKNSQPLWVGPSPSAPFLDAIARARLSPGAPSAIDLPGRTPPYRVIMQEENGTRVYLGYSDRVGLSLMRRLTTGFLVVWIGMVLLGFVISFTGAYRTLQRVERITETVAGISTDDLSSRLPEASHSDEITRLSLTFNRMLDRIQSSVHQLRVLTDSVAHDLKSPVTSIRGTLEVALSAPPPDPHWRELVADAIDKLDRLSLMLNTTLDLAEANAGALQLRREPLDLSELVAQLAELYRPSLAERQHTLHMHLQPVTVVADPALLGRALSNLLDNELAHLPPGCDITLRVTPTSNAAELTLAEFILEDNGPGLPPEVAARPFDRFVKGPHSQGHGLGLAFVEAIAHAHNGEISLANRPRGGITLTLSLPALVAPQKENTIPLETA